MLETVREFGLERLAASGEETATRTAHAAWCLARAEPAYREAFAPDSMRWFNAELDNLRAALDWFAATGESAAGLRLATALSWFWSQHGLVREARRWLERFLAEGIDLPPSVRSAALPAAGHMAFRFGEYELAAAYATEALPLARQHDDPLVLYWTLGLLGAVAAEH